MKKKNTTITGKRGDKVLASFGGDLSVARSPLMPLNRKMRRLLQKENKKKK